MSQRILQIHRDLIIADQWTEPHSPWQNPAELHGVKYLQSHAQTHKQNCLKLKKRDSRLNNSKNVPSGNSNYGNRDGENTQDMVFTATSDAERFEDDVWICDSSASSHYCALDRVMFDVQDINENF
jgi:hypothetical protein